MHNDFYQNNPSYFKQTSKTVSHQEDSFFFLAEQITLLVKVKSDQTFDSLVNLRT